MSASSMTVLCPNGRRTVVKVTPNTSILQIIEDACKKHGFNADQYNLKHLRRVLDVSSTVRYSGLPNNCQLELVANDVPRAASNVTVNIATESGLRLVHDFPATSTLWDILKHHEETGQAGCLLPPPDENREAVIVYTMRRISGTDLKSTTLKALGLSSGKCMFRYSLQTASTNTQAHVATPLTRPKVVDDKPMQVSEKNDKQLQKKSTILHAEQNYSTEPQKYPEDLSMRQPEVAMQPEPPMDQEKPSLVASSAGPDLVSSSHSGIPDLVQSKNNSQPDLVAEKGRDSPVPMDLIEGHDVSSSITSDKEAEATSSEPVEAVIKLGSHNAILFSMDDAPSSNLNQEDDSFFDLTFDEVKKLYSEKQKILRELDDAPLMTQQMRNVEESAKVLAALNQYPVTQLRIYFMDSHIIQASFKPTDTILQVMDFLRPFLADPSLEFSLQMRHPTKFLAPELSLVEADCVPNARLYCESAGAHSVLLSKDTLSKKSSFASAMHSLVKRKSSRQAMGFVGSGQPLKDSSQPSVSQGGSESIHNKRTSVNNRSTGATPKVPRWFKTAK